MILFWISLMIAGGGRHVVAGRHPKTGHGRRTTPSQPFCSCPDGVRPPEEEDPRRRRHHSDGGRPPEEDDPGKKRPIWALGMQAENDLPATPQMIVQGCRRGGANPNFYLVLFFTALYAELVLSSNAQDFREKYLAYSHV